MRVSDYIVDFFIKKNINTVFSVTGGFAMFLNDSIANNKNIDVIYQHHEQSCGYAAIGYTKTSFKPSIVCTTAGCGITNTISCINSCWHDNLPVIFISGQSKTIDTVDYYRKKNINIRNGFGSDSDIINIVKHITKYAVEIDNINDIEYELSKAFYLCNNGRKGPIVISVPIDLQGKKLTLSQLKPSFIEKNLNNSNLDSIIKLDLVKDSYNISHRPLLLIGGGINSDLNTRNKLIKFIKKYKIPCVFTFFAIDLFESNNELYGGRIGIVGERCGNFIIQNCDLLITLGCRLNKSQVGYNPQWFAREATKIMIDIDENEFKKNDVKIDHYLNMTINNFIENINFDNKDNNKWIEKCNHWKKKWFLQIPKTIETDKGLNPYYLIQEIGKINNKPTNYVTCSGTIITTAWHVLPIKKDDRFILSQQGEMGFELPAGIGCAKYENKQVVVLVGDGSIHFNIQELQTLFHHNFNIKIILINNNGYCCIRNTQTNYFKNIHGCDFKSNLSFPEYKKIANAYNIDYLSIKNCEEINNLAKLFNNDKPQICEVYCFDQERFPKLGAVKNDDGSFTGQPFENMVPFLDKEELENEMIVKLL